MTAPLVILVLRLLIVLQTAGSGQESWDALTRVDDSGMYITFSEDISRFPHEPPSFRMPGYPLLLFALDGLPGIRFLWIVILQQVLDLLVAIIVGRIAREHAGLPMWPVVSIYMILPIPVVHSLIVIPDTAMAATCAASGALWLGARRRGPAGFLLLHAAAGMALGLGTMLKQVMLFSSAVYLPLALVPSCGRKLHVRLAAAGLLAASALALPLAWRLHNSEAHGIDALSMQDSYETMGRFAILSGMVEQERFGLFFDSVTAACSPGGELDPAARDSCFRGIAVRAFTSNPVAVIIPHLVSWPMFFKPGIAYAEDLGVFQGSGRTGYLVLKAAAFMLNCAAGIALLASFIDRKSWRAHSALTALGLSWFAFSAITAGPLADNPRYGLPFYWMAPVFILLAVSRIRLFRRYHNHPAEPETSHTGMKGSA